MMTAEDLRRKFIDFFVQRGHKEVPSASLIPENDPTTLFISAGMHPLVPYLLGEPHPLGKRLCSVQKCLRTDDIDSVGDTTHHTFFEMMGNWSLGDYWKEEAISLSYEFLTKHLNIDPEKLLVTCFTGDEDAPRDEESANIWMKLGIPKKRIYFLGKVDNWWGPAGKTGPCGPDSEMFFDTGKEKCRQDCHPGCHCGKYIEIWNNVFMQYNKVSEGKYELLKQKNVDTGMGVERVGVFNGIYDNYQTGLFLPIVAKIEEISGKKYLDEENRKPMRIIADHLRAAVFVISEGIVPANTEQGYVLRKLIRRAVRFGKNLSVGKVFTASVAESVLETMGNVYPEIVDNEQKIKDELNKEEEKFAYTLKRGLKEFDCFVKKNKKLAGRDAFYLYESYGFPFELTQELAKEKNLTVSEKEFTQAQKEHQEESRIGAEKKFVGGLADHSEIATRYHTATHLLHQALREILGDHVHQVGSNITAERLRFDFTHPEKLSEEQLRKIERIINGKIEEDLPVTMETMSLKQAREKGALAFFEQKYGEQVRVYSIGPSMDSTSPSAASSGPSGSPQAGLGFPFSREICGGPHVFSTGEIKSLRIIKEESCGAGRRRIYAVI